MSRSVEWFTAPKATGYRAIAATSLAMGCLLVTMAPRSIAALLHTLASEGDA
jgi:hypothetical protein